MELSAFMGLAYTYAPPHEENIDHAIRALRVIGRFNRATHQNMQYGLSPQRVRDGLALFKVTTACCAWSYW